MKKIWLLCFCLLFASSGTLHAQDNETEAMIYLKNAQPYVLAEASAQEAQLSLSDEDAEVLKRAGYIERLKKYADEKQADLISKLEKAQKEGLVSDYQSYYIVNAIYVKGKKTWIKSLENVSGVKAVEYYHPDKSDIVQTNPELSLLKSEVTRGRDHGWEMNATCVINVWNTYALDGEGVVIGFIDSGVMGDHPALRYSYRGYDPESGTVSHEASWLDLIGDSDHPTDLVEHGTSVVASTLGLDPATQYRTGVATGSKWIAVRAFDQQVSTNQKIIEAGQWMLAPGGDPAKAPDIINNSWGSLELKLPIFNALVDAWKAADILPIFAAGNEVLGARDGSIENPANQPNTLAVGAIDENLEVAWFSKRGSKDGYIKPELVAPGMNMTTAVFGGYGSHVRGTSIAAGHVSGVAALVMEANPRLNQAEIESILIDSAKPLTDRIYRTSPNHAYGYGLVDAQKAVEYAIESAFERLYGPNRVQTSLEIAKRYFPAGADTIYIASANPTSTIDAFLASSLVELSQGPILLMSDVTPEIADYLLSTGVRRIIFVGGTAVLPDTLAQSIYDLTGVVPERLAGANRYQTAAIVAQQHQADTAFLVSGIHLADAVSITGIAADKGYPILLTDGKGLDAETYKILAAPNINQVIVVGGVNTVSDQVIKDFHLPITRIAGIDRFETNALVANLYYADSKGAIIANGDSLVDALSAAPLSSMLDSPIILTRKDQLSDQAIEYLLSEEIDYLLVVGGTQAVSTKALLELTRR